MADNFPYINVIGDDDPPSVHQNGIQEEGFGTTAMISGGSQVARGSVQDTAGNHSSVVYTDYAVGVSERQVIQQQKLKEDELVEKLRTKHEQLAATDEELCAKVQQLEVKDQQLKAKDEHLSTKDQQLSAKDQQLSAKDKQLKFKDEHLSVKDEHLSTKDRQLCTKDQQLSSKDQQLSAKDQHLSAKDQQLTAKDEQLCAKDEQLCAKDEQLKSKDERLIAKDEHLCAKDQQLKDKDKQLEAKDMQLRAKDEQLRKKDEELRVKDEQLKAQRQKTTEKKGSMIITMQKKQFDNDLERKQYDNNIAVSSSTRNGHDTSSVKQQLQLNVMPQQQEVVLSDGMSNCCDAQNEITITAPIVTFIPAKERILGCGVFGKVYEGECDGKPCAIKILNEVAMNLISELPLGSSDDKIQQQAKSTFKNERDILVRIKHDNVVALYDFRFYPKGDYPVLIMEKMECSLTQYFKQREILVSQLAQVSICCDVASALDYLQKNGIVHRDLCSDNVLLNSTKNGSTPIAKVSDFGMSRILPNFERMSAKLTGIVGGRTAYYPPEIQEDPESYDKSIDVFMFGVVMTQVAHCMPEIVSIKKRKELIAELPESHIMKSLIVQCVEVEQNKRPSPQVIHLELRVCLDKQFRGIL